MRPCVREFDVQKLKQVKEPLDVFLSHDWPRGIAKHGDMNGLMRKKKFLADELRDNSLGSPPAVRPRHVVSSTPPCLRHVMHVIRRV